MNARAVAASVLLALTLPLAACGGSPPNRLDVLVPPGSSPTPTANITTLTPALTSPPPGAEWLGWRPRYRDVRRPDPAEIADLGNRVTSRNASQWTATDALRGIEIAFTPTHVRAKVPRASLFLRLRPGGPLHSFVVCIAAECFEGGRDAVTTGPESTNAYLGQLAEYVRGLLAEQTRTLVLGVQGPTRLATVHSPGGRLTCVLHAADRKLLDGLEGRRVGVPGVVSRCVDTNGLVVPLDLGLPPGGWSDVVDHVSGAVRVKPSDVDLYEG